MLATSERTDTILIWQGIVLIAVLAVPALWVWVWPTQEQWFWLIMLALFGTAGQWLITRAYQVGEAAAPALPTWIGAAIVIGATLYMMRRNARVVVAAARSGEAGEGRKRPRRARLLPLRDAWEYSPATGRRGLSRNHACPSISTIARGRTLSDSSLEGVLWGTSRPPLSR
ncbi:hypothetical protein DWF00_14180 [Bosea caraganae]|uniref:Uncharacterized protein n=1 Tax=Bosea caraganae TaxID=2763117 RepID=A0A370KZB4_9HYPH|nr:hypothetical protein [Bosea caraganae]RDJ20333.1 hypothetical protein DWE98_24645 [Bosea caraganae]RDJ26585.1 hypothetical protein DWF00_14180 [Bosea caraganae]